MARKNVILPIEILRADMTASRESLKTNVQFLDSIGLQVKWTSTNAVGVIRVEGSNNWNDHLKTGDFDALTFNPTLTQPNANNGGYLIDLQQFPFSWLMVTYESTTPDAGASLLTCTLTAKEI